MEGGKFDWQGARKQLRYWDEYDPEEGGKDEGQKTLGRVWVERLMEEKFGVKMRGALRGYQDTAKDKKANSPTFNKEKLKTGRWKLELYITVKF